MIKNNIQSKHLENNFLKMSSKKFSKIIFEIDKDIKDSKKTLNVLDNKMKLNFKTKDLKQFKKFNTIAFIGMGGSILGTKAIYNFLEKKIKKFIFLTTLMKKK